MAPGETRMPQAKRVAVPHIQISGRIPMMVNPPPLGSETLYNTANPLRHQSHSQRDPNTRPVQDDGDDLTLSGPAESSTDLRRRHGNIYPSPAERHNEGPFKFRASRSLRMSALSGTASRRAPGEISLSRPGSFSRMPESLSTNDTQRGTLNVHSLKRSYQHLIAPESCGHSGSGEAAAKARKRSASFSRPMPGSFREAGPPTLS
ncbi:hypothetical protein BDZ45DRAFT_785242 [Acephala macrosclerotiorum]|nr:hypothetical protein BDZ45DRAFT_785242 [Acephala macrosclerotiorum]